MPPVNKRLSFLQKILEIEPYMVLLFGILSCHAEPWSFHLPHFAVSACATIALAIGRGI